MPFRADEPFRFLDLGCGTGVFVSRVLDTFSAATGIALDGSAEMLHVATTKTRAHTGRIEFLQHDLSDPLPPDLGQVDFVASFSAIHHLTDARKQQVYREVNQLLTPGGWFFLIDAMSVRFDNDVFATWKRRHRRRLEQRLAQAGVDVDEDRVLESRIAEVPADSPERDRISGRDQQVEWLSEAGFRSVDYVWHLFKEHFFICRA